MAGKAIKDTASDAKRGALEFIKDGLDSAEHEINQALDQEDSESDDEPMIATPVPTLTEAQIKTNRVFESYDTDSDEMISWQEWEEYVRNESELYDVTKEEDVNFWMNQRMDFNFIDFNRDDKVNKEEYEYWLNNPVSLTV